MDPSHAFYGIVITIDFRDRPPPHFHVRYGEHLAEISIDTLELIDGGSHRALRLVLEWAGEHQVEFRAKRGRARAREQQVGIDPLRSIWPTGPSPLSIRSLTTHSV